MPLRVTFDTNVLDLACRPDRFPKDSRQPLMKRVNTALTTGELEGFYSVTMLTIEGIMRRDRAKVFASTRLVMGEEEIQITKIADLPESIRQEVGGEDVETVRVEYRAEQPARAPLHPEVIARVKAAKATGVKVLKDVPRMGAFEITDSTKEWYLSAGEGDKLQEWKNRCCEVARAIEDRGLGIAQVKGLGEGIAHSNPDEAWYRCLDRATDIHAKRAVERAFSEWADGDSIASHIAYGLDIFCSDDVGKSNATNSVLDPNHRAWFTQTYGVHFMTFEDLASSLS